MKEIIKFELHKSICKPIVLITFIAILLMDIFMIFGSVFDGEPTYSMPYNHEKVEQLQQEQTSFAGTIDDAWTQHIRDVQDAILSNPANQVSTEERKKITQELLNNGLSREAINSPDNIVRFIKPEVLSDREFQSLEDPLVASGFYKSAEETGKQVAENYRSVYGGEKGEALASKAEKMYGYLSNGYKAYYDYNWGWSRLHAMQTAIPFTIGVFLLIVLSPLFSSEYANRTDSLLLSARYGKNLLIKAKIMTAFIIAIFSWLLIQIFNAILIFSLFGIEGAESFVQNWAVNPSPYAFTFLTSYFSVTALSFLGMLFLTSMILLISSLCKKSFISLVIGAVITLLPTTHLGILSGNVARKILMFFPTKIMIGIDYFKAFDAFYIFGKVIMLPVASAVVAAIILVVMIIGAYLNFKRHQVVN
ncbi:ABC transporter permease [uncultured Oscillibacter sp.]|uniref:ABC transporter permease n=1 Tax=uncultured Oscillibacter sp. TaxID=876091 RepID=UPI0025DCEF71|nr:ABC transporter permease subunit [uncultured Oscillibacter sp.]